MTFFGKFDKPVFFHVVLWHGKDGHSIPGYDSRDPNVITNQLKAMRMLAGDSFGVIALTFGHLMSPFIHQAVMAMCHQCNAQEVPFALCFDPWTVKNPDGSFPPVPERNKRMIAELQYADTQFILNAKCYLPGKLVFDFATGCDKVAITAAVPDIQYLLNGPDFDWPRIPPQPNKTKVPCVYIQFNDGTGEDRNKSVHDQTKPVRMIPSLGGDTFWGRNVDSNEAEIIQFATWNDYKEGTELEPFASMLGGEIW